MGRYVYRIDRSDQIQFVNSDWLEFARENEAPELTPSVVIGAPIWKFISGPETRILYESIFSSLRVERAEVKIPFRCDTPTVIRFMELTLRSLRNEHIELEGRLLERRQRQYFPLLDHGASRAHEQVVICSLCRRVRVAENEWIETHNAVVRLRLFSSPRPPRLIESVCPVCRDLVADINLHK